MTPTAPPPPEGWPPESRAVVRRTDLDWVRVGAFGLLILYHVGLVYSPYDWHIRSTHTFDSMRQVLLLTQPWRLTLLFLISGAALGFVSTGRGAASVLRARAARLGPPLLFGVLVLVPIQAWIEARDKGSWSGGLLDWMAHQFSPARMADGLPVNHLWFVIYIAAYTVAAMPLVAWPGLARRLSDSLDRALRGWRLLVLPAAYLIVVRCWLYYYEGITNNLIDDGYNHAQSLAAFLFGFLLARRDSVWDTFERLRWPALIVAAATLAMAVLQAVHPGGGAFHEIPRNSVFALDQWASIVAILGFARRWLRGPQTRLLRYLNDAVFPCYLAHQTVLVVAVWLLRPARLPAPLEMLSLVAITFAVSLLTYEIVRRIPLIRPLWGLKSLARPRPADPAAA